MMRSFKFMLALPLMACSTASAGEHDHRGSTIKPGADIQISAVQSEAGDNDAILIELTLWENRSYGQMQVEMINMSGLTLIGTPEIMDIDMADGDQHKMVMTVSAPQSGRYYAHAKVTQQGVFGPHSQVYAVPVQIGARAQTVPVNENGRIVFEADEEIR